MKQPEVTERTRQRLCRAFWHLYSRQPLGKITVKQVAELAGYNRATFYLYYSSVRDLLDQEEDALIARRQKAMDEQVVDVRADNDIRVDLTAFLEQTRKDAPYLKVLLGPHGDSRFLDKVRDITRPMTKDIFEQAHGTTRLSGKESEYLREFYLSGMISMIRLWLADPDPMPLDQLVECIIANFLPDVTAE